MSKVHVPTEPTLKSVHHDFEKGVRVYKYRVPHKTNKVATVEVPYRYEAHPGDPDVQRFRKELKAYRKRRHG